MSEDTDIGERLRYLTLLARDQAAGLRLGNQRSQMVGEATEFCDYQPYHFGMDLRHLDWSVLAKSDQLVVRRYQTETDLQCTIVLDLSLDLTAGEAGPPHLTDTKAGFALSLAATLVTFLSDQGESVGLELVGVTTDSHTSLPCQSGRVHRDRMMLALASARSGSRADLAGALMRIGAQTRRQSWVALISDGQEEPDAWLGPLAAFGQRRTEVVHLHLYDPTEWRGDSPGAAVLYSPEGGGDMVVDFAEVRDEFQGVIRDYLAQVRAGITRVGGRHILTSVHGGLFDPLHRAINRRAKTAVTPWD